MIANANIPCIHADPYFGTLLPGDTAYAEGYILFTEGDVQPLVAYLQKPDGVFSEATFHGSGR